ncbi:MAG: amidase [Burkholderiaceae bacterium]
MDIPNNSALALSQAIAQRQIGCEEWMRATLAQIARYNPAHLALVSLVDGDTLLAQARACAQALARGAHHGWLHGIPQAVKDLSDVAGLPTSMGSLALHPLHPTQDGLVAARLRAQGAIFVGKTNTPEFGLGSHTFNEVFGATRNAWNPQLSAGGSSGGAAVALALHMLPVVDGSDFMGSLRNPAGWNHVFGLRPTPGRVPYLAPAPDVLEPLGTEGPMARHIDDLAMMLATLAGPHPKAPHALADNPAQFRPPVSPAAPGVRVGWLGDLGGHLAFEDGILALCQQALGRLSDVGCHVDQAHLRVNLDDVWQAWLLWRNVLVGNKLKPLLQRPGVRAQIKPEAQWEYDQSVRFQAADLQHATATREGLKQAFDNLWQQFDVLALPVSQVWPFDVNWRWPQRINDKPMQTYHHWMEVVLYATFAGLPCLCVPAGFGANGLPMGLQLIGRAQDEWGLLQLGKAYETAAASMLAKRPPGLELPLP